MQNYKLSINGKNLSVSTPNRSRFRYSKENPYVSPGLSRETKKSVAYDGFKADVAEFNDLYMKDFHYDKNSVNKMGLGIDEVLSSSINFSRKNYACYFPKNPYPTDVKLVGNTIKSKKMPSYIANFLDIAVRCLLKNKGQEFLNLYYKNIDDIYNYRIPLKGIASRGKVKKSVQEYIADCKTITKAGRPKSRQAWMELAIKEHLNVNLGETIYYINTGTKKSESDVKKVTRYYRNETDELGEHKKDCRVELEKEYKKLIKENKINKEECSFSDFVKKNHSEVIVEDEIYLNCVYLPTEIVESETDNFDNFEYEYNVSKYIDQFNNRVKPLLVCFSPDIRNRIIITNPSDRPYFTKEECKLDSGNPNKPSDQDTYQQLMTMDDKEIKFWLSHPEWKIPFLEECHMNWDDIVDDYNKRKQHEKEVGADVVREAYDKAISELTSEDIENFEEEGKLPNSIDRLINIDPKTGNFVHKVYDDIVIGSVIDILEASPIDLMEYEE